MVIVRSFPQYSGIDMQIMRNRIVRILDMMREGTFERDEALALSLLSALAGESIFLLGLPGVGKSMIARKLKHAFKNARVFEYLMSRFSTPDEIFGPVSISLLKDQDRYERVTAGYLPEAEVVFLDEIWKAGPAIQNSLLTVLNERIYLNGNREMPLPLKGVIAASNELPAQDEGLEALWDRFMIRYIVRPILSPENFFRLIDGSLAKKKNPEANKKVTITESNDVTIDSLQITDSEYIEIRKGSEEIIIPQNLKETVFRIRQRLDERMNESDPVSGETSETRRTYYVSDRRWKKATGIMRTSALLNGRDEVDASDLLLLCHMLWNDDSCIPFVRQAVVEAVVAMLFHESLEKYKSDKRHAAANNATATRLFSPDGKHYVIEVEGAPMKLDKGDYERMMKSPTETFWGLETADGRIVLRERGQYALRWAKRGFVSINNFIYPLRTISDAQLDGGFLHGLDDSVAAIANDLYGRINRNLFLAASDIPKLVQSVVSIYKQRFQ